MLALALARAARDLRDGVTPGGPRIAGRHHTPGNIYWCRARIVRYLQLLIMPFASRDPEISTGTALSIWAGSCWP